MTDDPKITRIKTTDEFKSSIINLGYKAIKDGTPYNNFEITNVSVTPISDKRNTEIIDHFVVLYYFSTVVDGNQVNRYAVCEINNDWTSMEIVCLVDTGGETPVMLDKDGNPCNIGKKDDTGSSD